MKNIVVFGGRAMHIYQLGWNWKHQHPFTIERPNGHFGSQLILVRSKGRIVVNDREYHVQKNTAFLIEGGVPHCIYSDGEDYADDWIRFNFEQEDVEFINSLNLTFNVPILIKDEGISKLISACVDIFDTEIDKKSETLDYILKAILRHISEYGNIRDKNTPNFYTDILNDIKKRIYSNPAYNWSVPQIAAEMNISVSHFQRLYKKQFGISCINDVFISRMQYAKDLLLKTDYSAKEIALMCGYQNYEHFSRSFTKYACVSPVQYRSKYKEPVD